MSTESRKLIIPAKNVLSLCWQGDSLVDWAACGYCYDLDGTVHDPHCYFGYRFDAAITSPSGVYAAVYTRLGTKGLLLFQGRILREINRSYYHATAYEYPIVLFQLRDGREVIVHCPEEYNVLHIEEIDSGKRLTERASPDATDFFHSRLTVSPSATLLLSAGWIWHPYDGAVIFDLERALDTPSMLDHIDSNCRVFPYGSEISSVTFLSEDIVAISSSSSAEDLPEPRLKPGTVAVYNVRERQLISVAPVAEEVGTMMAVGTDHVVGFYGYPKLVHLESGRIVHRWAEVKSGKQLSSIMHHIEMPPPIALDPGNRRFAVAGAEGITVIML